MIPLIEEKEGQFLKVNRYQTQQNAVFINYEKEQLGIKLSTYTKLKFQQRLSLSKNILTIRQVLSMSKQVYQIIDSMAKDHEQIQRQILQSFKQIVSENILIRKNFPDFRQFLIRPLVQLIKGIHLQIKEQSCCLLADIMHSCKDSEAYHQQSQRIVKLAVELAHDQNQENKIVSIQLLSKILPTLQQSQVELCFESQYRRIYNQSTVRVKKEVINNLYVISDYVSQAFFQQKIIADFYMQCCRESAWGIRKACVQEIAKLMPKCNKQPIKHQIVNMLLNFLKDGNKIVRVSAYKAVPQILANYGSNHVPAKLFDIYLKLIHHQINQSASSQYQIISQVSFFFPGVLFTVGKEKWPQMKKLFQKLLKYKQETVKIPIASSLHDIARIIGPEASKQTIFIALDQILKDHSDRLKLNAVAHLSQFVELFDKVTQQNLIDVFLVLQKDPKKWRIRHSIASQLGSLSKIYEAQINFKYIIPIALKLCNDNVSQVRDQAARQILGLIENLKEQPQYQKMSLESIKGFGVSQKSIQRQSFSRMIAKMFDFRQVAQKYSQQLLQAIMPLCQDKVDLVRITIAMSVIQIIQKRTDKIHFFKQVIQKLVQDEQIFQYFDVISELLQQNGIKRKLKQQTILNNLIQYQSEKQHQSNIQLNTLLQQQQNKGNKQEEQLKQAKATQCEQNIIQKGVNVQVSGIKQQEMIVSSKQQ